jgi:hypothetical protein
MCGEMARKQPSLLHPIFQESWLLGNPSDAGTPPSDILPTSPICQVSVPPSLLAISDFGNFC